MRPDHVSVGYYLFLRNAQEYVYTLTVRTLLSYISPVSHNG